MSRLALLLALSACTPAPSSVVPHADASDAAPAPPEPAPMPDATPATPSILSCAEACAALTAAGCPEGTPDDCARTLSALEAHRIKRIDGGSWLTCDKTRAVKTPSDARALGITCAGDGGLR